MIPQNLILILILFALLGRNRPAEPPRPAQTSTSRLTDPTKPSDNKGSGAQTATPQKTKPKARNPKHADQSCRRVFPLKRFQGKIRKDPTAPPAME